MLCELRGLKGWNSESIFLISRLWLWFWGKVMVIWMYQGAYCVLRSVAT